MVKKYLKDKAYPEIFGEQVRAYLDLTRPFTLIPPAIVGVFLVLLCSLYLKQPFDFFLAVLCGLVLALLQAGGQVFNQSTVEEVLIDKENKKDYRPTVKETISLTDAKIAAAILFLSGILLAFSISFSFGLWAIVIAFFAVFYTAGIRAKKRFLISNLWQGIARGGLPFLAVWSVFAPFNSFILALAACSAIFASGAQATKDINDVKGDKKFGVNSLFVVFNKELAINIIDNFMIWSLVLALIFVGIGIFPLSFILLILIQGLFIYLIDKNLKKAKTTKLLENTKAWFYFYASLAAWYILPALLLVVG